MPSHNNYANNYYTVKDLRYNMMLPLTVHFSTTAQFQVSKCSTLLKLANVKVIGSHLSQ